jgi:Bacteriophage tail sheath protein
MPEYLAPGVYVEEVDTGSKPIEGVSTSTSGMVGVTERGPVNSPTFVTGFADYTRQFGGFLNRREFAGANWLFPHAVDGFFTNGGKRLFVVRVLPDEATHAQLTVLGGAPGGFASALAASAAAGEGYVIVDSTTGLAVGDWLLIDDGTRTEYVQVSAADVLSLRMSPLTGQSAGTDVVPVTFAEPAAVADQLSTNPTDAVVPAGVREILLDEITNIVTDSVLRIGTGDTVEFVVVGDNVPATEADPVPLRAPLAFEHVAAEDVVLVEPTDAPGTQLANDVEEDGQIVVVADETPLAGADAIAFGAPPHRFYVTVGQLGVTVVEAPGFRFRHTAGTAIVEPTLDTTVADTTLAAPVEAEATEIQVQNRSNLDTDTWLRLDGANGVEYIKIAQVDADATPGPVTLERPLRVAYAAGDTASPRKDDGTGDANATALARTTGGGETALALVEGGAYAGTGVLRVGPLAGARTEYLDYDVTAADSVAIETLLRSPHAAGAVLGERTPFFNLRAIDRGAWGNCLRATAEAEDAPTLDTTTPGGNAGDATLTLATGVGVEPGAVLEFYVANPPAADTILFRQKVESVSGRVVTFGPGGLEQTVGANTRVRTAEFKLTVECIRTNPKTQAKSVDPALAESLRNLNFDPRHSRYVEKVIGRIPSQPNAVPPELDERGDGESSLVRVDDLFNDAAARASERTTPDLLTYRTPEGEIRPFGLQLEGGDDQLALLSNQTFIGVDAVNPTDRTGLQALKNVDDVSIVAIPGRTAQAVQQAMLAHCELMRYRFAVLDSERGRDPFGLRLEDVQTQRSRFDSKYGALYYPWLVIDDPFAPNPNVPEAVKIPPSGHMIGIYARTDAERGVHKAPANEVVRGINDLQVKLVKEQQDLINPRNINALRDFRDRGRGLRVWGARCVTSDPDWRYINVRRLFNFVEASIERGTQWVVFEPNDFKLWARVTQSVSAFLTSVWRDGALMGRTADEAFYVRCDETTMSQYDIDNGRLIMLIGIAPVKPAEFVIIRIGQWAGGSLVEEA